MAELAPADAESGERRARHERRIKDAQDLRSFVDDVVAQCDAVAAASDWTEVAGALRHAVKRFLGDPKVADRWGRESGDERWRKVEREGYDALLVAIDALSPLDEAEGRYPPTYDGVQQALARQLDHTLTSGTTLGRGITVAQVRDIGGADLDLLVVLGMTEDSFPPRIRENPILRDDERREVPGLQTVADRRRAERRDFLAAVASARSVVLSTPRADTRAQRGLHPSPWFMEAVARLNEGVPVASGELAELNRPWLSRHDSFEQSLRTALVPASTTEFDLAAALEGHPEVLAADHAICPCQGGRPCATRRSSRRMDRPRRRPHRGPAGPRRRPHVRVKPADLRDLPSALLPGACPQRARPRRSRG